MGKIIPMFRDRKAPDNPAPSLRQLVLQELENRKAFYGPNWSRWKVKKKNPDDRAFLIQLARNMAEILDELPAGTRGKALEAARGDRTQETGDANKYVTRLALPLERSGTPEELVRPLTPSVGRYIAVARQAGVIHGNGEEHFLGTLFRETPLDTRSQGMPDIVECAWAQDLATVLEKVCASISRRQRLGPLFDEMYAANIQASDNGRAPDYNLSSWLSETYGEGGGGSSDLLEAVYSTECTEPGVPWSGLAFFVMRVQLLAENYELGLGPARLERVEGCPVDESVGRSREIHAKLEFQLETWLAIASEVDEPGEPCRTRASFLLHPRVSLSTASGMRHIWEIAATEHDILFTACPKEDDYNGCEVWRTARFGAAQFGHRPERFMRWFSETTPPTYNSLAEDNAIYLWRAVLQPGVWWILPVDMPNVERVLGEVGAWEPFHLSFEQPSTILGCPPLEDLDALDTSILPGIVPRLAPAGTAAHALQLHLMAYGRDSLLIQDLEADTLRIRGAFDRMKKKVRDAVDERFAHLINQLDSEDPS